MREAGTPYHVTMPSAQVMLCRRVGPISRSSGWRSMRKLLTNHLLRALRLALSLLLYVPVCSSYAAELSPEIVHIPVDGALGASARMVAGVFRPAGDGPFPVLVYSHGRSGTNLERGLTRIP